MTDKHSLITSTFLLRGYILCFLATTLLVGCSSNLAGREGDQFASPLGLVERPEELFPMSLDEFHARPVGQDVLRFEKRRFYTVVNYRDAEHPLVVGMLKELTDERRLFIIDSLEGRKKYVRKLVTVFEELGVPVELVDVALVESQYQLEAESHQGAVGLWQLMAPIAREYDLNVSFLYDERLDINRSTEAAGKILLDLYDRFDDWPLALAAYNAGATKVQNAITEAQSRDFYVLAEKRLLPRESIEFVAKVLAVAKIFKSPDKYGFG